MPNLKVTVFAVVTPMNGLTMMPKNKEFVSYDEDHTLVLDLGDCNVCDTLSADILLINETLANQSYFFPDLPQVKHLKVLTAN